MDWPYAATLFAAMIISLTLHEAAHGLVARLGGDPTAYKQGLVTVNPLPHMRRSPMMMVVVPLVMLWQTGGQMCIAAASAPIDARWAVSFPRRAALMALASSSRRQRSKLPIWRFTTVSQARASALATAMRTVKRSAYSSRPAIWLTPDQQGREEAIER